ncbi:MAG: hypothetical protein CM1200mP25_0430 [Acidobacteriota bacterium]|nr:MAG: hypothetical protein CM1200mP25_0430 [Acidobacteriota bacterium]
MGPWLNVRARFFWFKPSGLLDKETDGPLIRPWSAWRGGVSGEGRPPQIPKEFAVARARSGFHHVRIDSENCALSRAVDAAIDAGGFGKGAALDRVRQGPLMAGFVAYRFRRPGCGVVERWSWRVVDCRRAS